MVYLPHWPIPATFAGRKIDFETVFERIKPVLEKLGNPHKKLPPVIHVTGTNGKGSVTAFLAAFFQAANYKTHIYTSPHLHDCNERIVLANHKITDGFLFEIMEEVRIAADDASLTFFEAFTIGAFLAFAKVPADVAIIEVGMGGRIDATNIIEEKLLNIITPISFDHTEYLGDKIAQIALEKSLIARKNTPFVVAPQPLEAWQIIELIAKDFGAKLVKWGEDFAVEINENDSFNYADSFCSYNNLPAPALIGEHQYINAATAIAAINTILQALAKFNSRVFETRELGSPQGGARLVAREKINFKIEQNHIVQGLKSVKWANRLEKVENGLNKLLKSPQSEIFIDGAHNVSGAFSLKRWLEEENEKKVLIIVGFSRDKCKAQFLQQFQNVADEICAIRVEGEPYPESAEKIAEIGKELDLEIKTADDLATAIRNFTDSINHQPCKIVICGSLHLARDVRKYGG